VSKEGLGDLQSILKDKTTLVAGRSGVGKSTLVNAVEPTLKLRTEEISDFSGKGQHTTTFAEMYDLSFGGHIIDTPGIKTLAFSHLEVMDIAHNFREFFALSDQCKFANCTHRNEPKCALKAALETGEVSLLRYQNYLGLLEEVEDQNYWERHSDV
jgi:ribosome biogenesis GTPase